MIFTLSSAYGQNKKDSAWNNWIDFNKITVTDFIKMLPVKKQKDNTCYVITIGTKAKVGWVKETDIDTLISLIDSREPAYCIMQVISSQLPINENSTLGGQVMNLLDAYRFKKEFPFFLTDCSKNDEKRKNDILAWYKEFKNK